jgi:hypothetical protein
MSADYDRLSPCSAPKPKGYNEAGAIGNSMEEVPAHRRDLSCFFGRCSSGLRNVCYPDPRHPTAFPGVHNHTPPIYLELTGNE